MSIRAFPRSFLNRVRAQRLVALAIAPVLLAVSGAGAQPVMVTSNTSLSPADTVFPGTLVPVATAEVTVQNATLTIDGEVSIASLIIAGGGVVTHDAGFTYDADPGPAVQTVGGFHLHTSGDITVSASGLIDAGGKGQLAGPGAGASAPVNLCGGGGGHGGSGGSGSSVAGGGTYGSFSQPTDLGSGGGGSGSTPGKRGGGTVRLSVGGVLTVNGTITADGPLYDGTYPGGGSGGSIWITAATVIGTGAIHANGGGTNACGNGSGGGGRVAVYGDLSSFNGASNAIQARGFSPGTVYRAQTGQSAQLIFDNGGTAGISVQTAPLVVPTGVDVFVRNGANLSHPTGSTGGLSIQVADNLTIESGGFIDVTGQGNSAGMGAGAAAPVNTCGGGGGYGGSGGNGSNGAAGGGSYGSFSQPTDLGSAGGASGTISGKRGGGAVRLIVGGTLTVNGVIAADGPAYDGTYPGGGSGGSIWITATTLTGTGTIHANGGGTSACGNGAGGGGRVAVYGDLASFNSASNAIQARGFSAGTVYRAQTGQSAQLIFDNGGTAGTSIQTAPLVVPTGVNVSIRNGAALSHAPGDTNGLTIQVADNLTVESGGLIDVTGQGLAAGPGAGAAAPVNTCGGGGGYGGSGASGSNALAGGLTYGSFSQPSDLGSAGGGSGAVAGKRGGGAVHVTVGGTLTVNGGIAADGPAYDGTYPGGGSGGSIWIAAGAVAGTGSIHANGGGTSACGNGGGGGGRVAVYGDLTGFNASATAIQARGSGAAGAGSVYRAQPGQSAQLIFDNGGSAGTSIQGAPLVVPAGVDVFLRNGAALSHAPGDTNGLSIQVADNFTIESGGLINVTGQGYAAGPGAGASAPVNTCGGGGGYGGAGANGSNAVAGGETYGSASEPTDLGSGGGGSGAVPGKRGGGAVHLVVGGVLTVNGTIAADGPAYDGTYPGGGSGGSIWITSTGVAGTGMIHANGGGTTACGNGGGGGGRIALHACTVTTPLANIISHGSGSAANGSVFLDATALTVVSRIVSASNQCPGATIALIAETVHGSGFEWLRNGVPIVDGPGLGGAVFSGANTSVLTVSNVSSADGLAEITVSVMNSCGAEVSAPPLHLICSADFNCSGLVTVQDIFDFLAAWFAADPRADFNGTAGISVQDIFDFLSAWFGGC